MTENIELVVRGFHLDVFGHVNNARYLEFLEEARWELFGQSIDKLREKNYSLNIANININYRLPTFLGQKLLIDAKITRIGNKSFTLQQDIIIKESGSIACDAAIICVVTDNVTGKSIPFVGELETLFRLSNHKIP